MTPPTATDLVERYGPPDDRAEADDVDNMPVHICRWGPLERSWFAGTVHRKCQVDGCRIINAYDDDPPDEEN